MHVDVRDFGTNRGNEPFEITRYDALGNDGTGDYSAACITLVTFPNCGQRGASPVGSGQGGTDAAVDRALAEMDVLLLHGALQVGVLEFISNRPGLVIDVRLEMPSGRRGNGWNFLNPLSAFNGFIGIVCSTVTNSFYMAERVRFELTRDLRPCRFSSLACLVCAQRCSHKRH